MLADHFAAVEASLLAQAAIPANAGHMLHRGTPREWFIRDFLERHISKRLSIGSGEIIDSGSRSRELRNQHDIVLHNADYPRINLGGGLDIFLSESVLATIEIKSLLTEAELETATLSARATKRLSRHFTGGIMLGMPSPGIRAIAVAFAGPATMETVKRWVDNINEKHSINKNRLAATGNERTMTVSDGLDAIFVLGNGCIMHDCIPVSIVSDEGRSQYPDAKYITLKFNDRNLLILYLVLSSMVPSISSLQPNFERYLENLTFPAEFYP